MKHFQKTLLLLKKSFYNKEKNQISVSSTILCISCKFRIEYEFNIENGDEFN